MISMTIHPLAGKPPPKDLLIDADHLRREYYTRKPDLTDRAQRVSFGTSGHRGSSLRGSFNEWHVVAITQAICDYRSSQGISGPLYIGKDTHALSEPAFTTALEVLAANSVETMIDSNGGYTPTPAVSHAILTFNLGRTTGLADGIVITPSHNPPEDGGFKYNPPSGGPADTVVTSWIEDRANQLLSGDLRAAARMAYNEARRAATTHAHDYIATYVADLGSVVDMEVIAGAQLKIGVDPLGGARPRSGSGFTWKSRMTEWIRRSPSCRWTGTARFVWIVRHPTRWQTDWAQRPLRYRLWQRPRRRPTRHRDAQRRSDESEPLPCSGDFLSLYPSSGLAARGSDRQDRREQQHHRPRRRQGRAYAGGGASRIQMVRAGPPRSITGLRRRRECRRVVSPAQRYRLDDG